MLSRFWFLGPHRGAALLERPSPEEDRVFLFVWPWELMGTIILFCPGTQHVHFTLKLQRTDVSKNTGMCVSKNLVEVFLNTASVWGSQTYSG